MQRTVNIIVVTFNQPEYFKKTIESVKKNTEYPYKLTTFLNKKNEWLCKLWNDFIKKSKCDYICLLNDDVYVTKSWLTKMMNVFDDNTGVVGPSTSFACSKQQLGEYREKRLEYTDEEVEKIGSQVGHRFNDEIQEVEEIIGFCYIFKKETFNKVGKFREVFGYGGGEESELNHRFLKNGYKLKWVKGSYVHHYGSITKKKVFEDGTLDEDKEVSLTRKMMKKYVQKN